MHFISDEIYALSVWENTVDELQSLPVPFESALSIDTTGIIDPSLVHVLWGMSKDFGANGLRLGVIVSQKNADLHMALKGVTLYSYSSCVSDHLASIILEDHDFTDRYIQQNQQKLSESYAFAVQLLKNNGIEYAAGGNAAFFLWINLGRKYRAEHPDEPEDSDVGDKLMKALMEKKVFVSSGALFGSEQSGWFRLVFSQPREYIEEALRRVMLAME
jgi:1-aminocyclopropane-1-carboxylate synthase